MILIFSDPGGIARPQPVVRPRSGGTTGSISHELDPDRGRGTL